MTDGRHFSRAGLIILLGCLIAAPGCGIVSDLFGPGEITPTEAISDLVTPAVEIDQPGDAHFVMTWKLLGPFTFDEDDFGGGHQQAASDGAFMPDEACLNGTQKAPAETAWKTVAFSSFNGNGKVDLDKQYDRVEHAAAYAVAWVHCPQEITNAKLLIGSDDYITVWINRELVFTYNVERRAGQADDDVVDGITLKKGFNRIVVKCVDVVFGWDFYLRFADADYKAFVTTPRPPVPKPAE